MVEFIKRSKDQTCQIPSPQLKCSNYKSTFNHTVMINDNDLDDDNSQKRQASMSCAPTFVIPGFMKAGMYE